MPGGRRGRTHARGRRNDRPRARGSRRSSSRLRRASRSASLPPGASGHAHGRAHGRRRRRGAWTVSIDAPAARRRGRVDPLSPAGHGSGPSSSSRRRRPQDATEATHTGFVVLERGGDRRRIPFWFRVAAPKLGAGRRRHRSRSTGTYQGDTRGHPALVDSYRYPDDRRELGVPRAPCSGRSRCSRSHADATGRELRCRGPGGAQRRRAAHRPCRRREPSCSARSALPVQREPVPARLRGGRAASPAQSSPGPATTTSSSTAARPRGRALHVPVLDRGRDTAGARPRSPRGRAPAHARCRDTALGDRSRGSCGSRSTATSHAQSFDAGRREVSARPDSGLRRGRHDPHAPRLGLPGAEEHGERAPRSCRTRGASAPSSRAQGVLSQVAIALVRRRQLREVALDAGRELVAASSSVCRSFSWAFLPRAGASAAPLPPEAGGQTRPLGSDRELPRHK